MSIKQKKIQKTAIVIIAGFLFSLFFYQQHLGLNVLLFAMLTNIVLAVTDSKTYLKSNVLIIGVVYFFTGISVFLYCSTLTIITNILAFFTLIGSCSSHSTSIYIKWINGTYTTAVAAFTIYLNNLYTESENVKKLEINYGYWAKIITIPSVIIGIFINLYRNGNPKFDALIADIDFSFINFGWVVFTALGCYIFYNITNSVSIEPATSLDLQIKNDLKNEKSIDPKKEKSEIQLGTILLVSLNILIILFLCTDVLHLSEIHSMSAPQLSKQVHTGVDALIASNVLAIVIILYFFRGNLNFTKNNSQLKKLTLAWIVLNLLMICITAIKNTEYIASFGLTYKRIGVLFFLLITAVCLITTYIKVIKIKNLWFLFRKNIQIAFTILVLSSFINWDKIVTYYNINYAAQLDGNYLIALSNNNVFLLKDYAQKYDTNIDLNRKINVKYSEHIRELKANSWQEMVFDNYKIR